MKKQTLIIIILCILVSAVITLNVLGITGTQDGVPFVGQTIRDNGVSSPVSMKPMNVNMDYAFPTIPS